MPRRLTALSVWSNKKQPRRQPKSGAAVRLERLEARQLMSTASSPQITEYPLPAGVKYVYSMVKGSDGAVWFNYGTVEDGVGVGRMSAGGFLSMYPIAPGDGGSPIGYSLGKMVVGSDGNLWMFETESQLPNIWSSMLVRVTPGGAITSYPQTNFGVNAYGSSIISGPDGNLWLAESSSPSGVGSMIERVDPRSGALLSQWTFPSAMVSSNGIYGIAAMTLSPDGKSVWFVEAPYILNMYPYHVDGIDSNGNITFRNDMGMGPVAGRGGGVGVSSNGNLWIGNPLQNYAEIIAPNGYVSVYLQINSSVDFNALAICSPGDGLSYVGGAGSGIASLDPNQFTLGYNPGLGNLLEGNDETHFNTRAPVTNMMTGSDGNIWFSEGVPEGVGGVAPVSIGCLNIHNPHLALTDNATGPVNPGDKIHLTLSANFGADLPDAAAVNIFVPSATYVPGSSPDANLLPDGTLQFTLTGHSQATFSFDMTVNDAAHLALGISTIDASGYATAVYPDGRTTHNIVADSIKMGTVSSLYVDLQPQLSSPGIVQPGQTFTVNLMALCSDDTQQVTISFNAPSGTTMFVSTWTTGGMQGATSVSFENTGQAKGTVTLTVNDAAHFPPGDTLTLTATGSTIVNGQTITKSYTVTLKIAAPIQVTVVPSVNIVTAGGIITYTINARAAQAATAWVLENSIPQGTTYVPGSATQGGQLTTNAQGIPTMQWNLGAGATTKVSFAVKVNALSQLNAGITQFSDVANAAAIINGASVTGTGSVITPLAQPTLVSGKIRDVVLDYPRVAVTDIPELAGASVQLLAADGKTLVATTTTDSSGNYQFAISDPGDYFVKVIAAVQQYDSGANSINHTAGYLSQPPVKITIKPGSTAPLALDDVYLPVSLVNKSADEMQKLNNLAFPVLGGVFNPAAFRYDTTACEAIVGSMVSGSSQLPCTAQGITGGPGRPASKWAALARTIGVMDGVLARFNAAMKLADDFAKNAALVVTAQAIKNLAPVTAKLNPLPTGANYQKVEQLILQRTRVEISSATFAVLGPAMNLLGLDGHTKTVVAEVIGKSKFIITDLFTRINKLGDDAVFELIYDTIRYTLSSTAMTQFFGASSSIPLLGSPARGTGFQGVLDQAFNFLNTGSYRTTVYTADALKAIRAGTTQATDEASAAHINASTWSFYLSFGRAAEGTYGITQGILFKGGQSSVARTFFQKTLGAVMTVAGLPLVNYLLKLGYFQQETAIVGELAAQIRLANDMIIGGFGN